jgi:hypothetical protein
MVGQQNHEHRPGHQAFATAYLAALCVMALLRLNPQEP